MISLLYKSTFYIVLLAAPITYFAQTGDPEGLRKTISQLKAENERLRVRVAELEKRADAIAIRDHMTKEEQRVENLLSQLVVIGEKESALQGRLEEVEEGLRTENIDQLPVNGSLRPEEVRESVRRR